MKENRFTQFVVVFCILVFLVAPLSAQKTKVKVDGQIIKDYITKMADDKYLGRKPATPEFDELLNWAADKYKEWGLEPAGDDGTYFQKVPLEGSRGTFTFSKGTPRLVIDNREFYAKYGDFTVDERSTTGKTINSNVVFVGYGISAPDKGLDEYAGVNVNGKIVFVYKGSPNDAATVRSSFGPAAGEKPEEEDWEELTQDSTKIKTAYSKGAAGIMFYDAKPSTGTRFRMGMRRGAAAKFSFTHDFIIVSSVNERIYQWIFFKEAQESQRAFARRMSKIQNDIKEKKPHSFATKTNAEIKGYTSTDFFSEAIGNNYCKNVVGKITGTDRKLKNEYIVLGGHYDHLGVRNGQVFNGADDNASGTAVVMEIARLMKKHMIKTKRTIIFGLWTGEEMGLIGSRYWVKNPTLGISMDQVVTNFNMDMVALGDKIGAPGALNFPNIWEIILKDQDQDILDALEPSEAGPGGSDYAAFIELGIEALALMTSGGGGHPDYHDTGDDSDVCEPEILRKTGQFVLQGTINVGNKKGSLVMKNRQHMYDGMQWNIIAMNADLNAAAPQDQDIMQMMRGGGNRGWTVISPSSKDEMTEAVNKKIKELKNPSTDQQSSQMRMFRRFARPGANMNKGIKGGESVGFDIAFLAVAKNALDFGRVDVKGDDGVWFSNGMTEKGKAALTTMEDNGITLCLINPTDATFSAVLAASEKPFVVCGKAGFTPEQVTQINEKKVLIGVDYDPAKNNKEYLKKLEDFKVKIGDADNLRLNLLSKENLAKSKKDLYMKLIDKGWTKDEIYALGGQPARRRR
jgi:hypothetical protein